MYIHSGWENALNPFALVDIELRIDYYSTVYSPALSISFQSAASIDLSNCWSSHARLHLNRKHGLIFAPVYSAMLQTGLQSCSQPWRVLFLERQSRLRHFKSHKVHDSWADALWTQNEDDWIWGWLWSYCTIVFVNHDVFTLWGLYAYPRNSKRKNGPCGFLFIPL